MNTTLERHGDLHRLCVEGELTIYAVAALKVALLDALAASAELEVDLLGVTEADTAGIQLLLAAKLTAAAAGTALRLVNHSAPVLELIELYDLAGRFGDPLILSATESAAA